MIQDELLVGSEMNWKTIMIHQSIVRSFSFFIDEFEENNQ